MKHLFVKIFHSIPFPVRHEMRRNIIRFFHPKVFGKLQWLRKHCNSEGFTFKSFDDHECIFVHIPKCAGISISTSLFGNKGGGHFTIWSYQVAFNAQEFKDYFKFTFVRNPWDRLVSAYFFLKQGGMSKRDSEWAEKNLACYKDFDSFVRGWVNRDNIQTYYHFRPQHQFICDHSYNLLVDFIGYYENIESDFLYIKNKINPNAVLHTENVTNARKRDYKEYYSRETKQLVADVYAEDIRIFGYDFDLSIGNRITRPAGINMIERQE